METDVAVAHRRLGLLDTRIAEPPLPGEARLDGHVGAFGVADVVLVGLLLHEGAAGLQELDGALAAGETVHAGEVGSGEVVERAVGVEHVDRRELVALADLKIHLVVRRRDLQRAGTEFPVHHRIGDDGNLRRRPERAAHLLTEQRGVARVVGMHGNRHVAGNRLGARGLDRDVLAGAADDFIAHLVEVALHRLHDDFLVGQGRERHRAPVHHALAAIDVPLGKKVREHGEHRLGVVRVHREGRAAPVARGAERAQLLENHATLLLAPRPDLREELVAAQVAAVLLLLAQLPFDDGLGRDAGVVGARQPQGFPAFQARPADEDVLQGVVQHVAHRQHARHIGRRDHDAVGPLARIHPARKRAGCLPGGIPFFFNLVRFVALADFGHGRCGDMNRGENRAGRFDASG